jgi:hypothetical protein
MTRNCFDLKKVKFPGLLPHASLSLKLADLSKRRYMQFMMVIIWVLQPSWCSLAAIFTCMSRGRFPWLLVGNKLFATVFAKLMTIRSPACSCLGRSSWTIPLWEICLILPPRIDYMELCNTGSFATFPGSQPHRESSIKPSRRVPLVWTNVRGEVGNLLGYWF